MLIGNSGHIMMVRCSFASSQPLSGGDDVTFLVRVLTEGTALFLMVGVVTDYTGAKKTGVALFQPRYFQTSIEYYNGVAHGGIYETPLDGGSEVEHYTGATTKMTKGDRVTLSYESRTNQIRFSVNGKAYGGTCALKKSIVYYPAVTVSCKEKATLEVECFRKS